jgi:hypothetical protein
MISFLPSVKLPGFHFFREITMISFLGEREGAKLGSFRFSSISYRARKKARIWYPHGLHNTSPWNCHDFVLGEGGVYLYILTRVQVFICCTNKKEAHKCPNFNFDLWPWYFPTEMLSSRIWYLYWLRIKEKTCPIKSRSSRRELLWKHTNNVIKSREVGDFVPSP